MSNLLAKEYKSFEDIHRKKNLKVKQKILDFMGSEELAAKKYKTG